MQGRTFLRRPSILLAALAMLVAFWASNAAFGAEFVVNGVPSETAPPEVEEAPAVDVASPQPNQTVINFDDVVAPCLFNQTVALRNQYSGSGVTFSGPAPLDGGAILDECGNFGVTGHSPPNFLAFNTGAFMLDGGIPRAPQTISFSPSVSSVDVLAGSRDGAGQTLVMEAYSASGGLLDSDSIVLATGMQLLDVSANDIAYVIILNSSPSHIFVLDNLMFEAGGGTWPKAYDRVFGRTGSQGAVSVLRDYRDRVLMADPLGAELVNELYDEHSEALADLLLDNLGLALRGARMIRNRLPDIAEAVEDGGMIEMSRLELARAQKLLGDLAEVADAGLAAFLGSVQAALEDEAALEGFGIAVKGR